MVGYKFIDQLDAVKYNGQFRHLRAQWGANFLQNRAFALPAAGVIPKAQINDSLLSQNAMGLRGTKGQRKIDIVWQVTNFK